MISNSGTLIFLLLLPGISGLPCLTHDSKAKFEAQKRALQTLKTDITNRISSLQSSLNSRVNSMDSDMSSLMTDFKKKEWKKYNGHCYYFGSESMTWFLAERRCKQIGGYLAVVDDSSEYKWIADNMPIKTYYWNGLTDLKEGEWRWSYDQSVASYKPWASGSGYGSRGTSYNCAIMYYTNYWIDQTCHSSYRYVCESNFCF